MSDNPIINLVGSGLNPLGAVGAAPFQAKGTDQIVKAYTSSGLEKPPDTGSAPTPPSGDDPKVQASLDRERASQRLAAGRSSTVQTRTGLGDVNLFRRSLLGQ